MTKKTAKKAASKKAAKTPAKGKAKKAAPALTKASAPRPRDQRLPAPGATLTGVLPRRVSFQYVFSSGSVDVRDPQLSARHTPPNRSTTNDCCRPSRSIFGRIAT